MLLSFQEPSSAQAICRRLSLSKSMTPSSKFLNLDKIRIAMVDCGGVSRMFFILRLVVSSILCICCSTALRLFCAGCGANWALCPGHRPVLAPPPPNSGLVDAQSAKFIAQEMRGGRASMLEGPPKSWTGGMAMVPAEPAGLCHTQDFRQKNPP